MDGRYGLPPLQLLFWMARIASANVQGRMGPIPWRIVVIVRKEDRVQTWGFKVRSGLEITKSTEIFYWQKCFLGQNQVDDVYYKHPESRSLWTMIRQPNILSLRVANLNIYKIALKNHQSCRFDYRIRPCQTSRHLLDWSTDFLAKSR